MCDDDVLRFCVGNNLYQDISVVEMKEGTLIP